MEWNGNQSPFTFKSKYVCNIIWLQSPDMNYTKRLVRNAYGKLILNYVTMSKPIHTVIHPNDSYLDYIFTADYSLESVLSKPILIDILQTTNDGQILAQYTFFRHTTFKILHLNRFYLHSHLRKQVLYKYIFITYKLSSLIILNIVIDKSKLAWFILSIYYYLQSFPFMEITITQSRFILFYHLFFLSSQKPLIYSLPFFCPFLFIWFMRSDLTEIFSYKWHIHILVSMMSLTFHFYRMIGWQ